MGFKEQRWRDNWRAVSPAGAIPADLRGSARERRELERRVSGLASGTPVVLFAAAPGARGRCRSFASRAGLVLERHYLAYPSAAAPAYLVEDAAAPVRFFVDAILAPPPGSRLRGLIGACLAAVRTTGLAPLAGRLAPGRVVVGRRF